MISVFKKTYPTLRYNDLLACLDNVNIVVPFIEGFHLLYNAFCIASEAPLSPLLLFSPWKNDLQQIRFISNMINTDVGVILKSSEVIVCFPYFSYSLSLFLFLSLFLSHSLSLSLFHEISITHQITNRHSIASKRMTVGEVLTWSRSF